MLKIFPITKNLLAIMGFGIIAATVGAYTLNLLTKPIRENFTVSADENGIYFHEDRSSDRYQIQAKQIKPNTLEISVTRRWRVIEIVGMVFIMMLIIGSFIRAKNRDETLFYSVSKAKSHPLYPRYIQEDPERQFLEDLCIVKDFSRWLKSHSDKQEVPADINQS